MPRQPSILIVDRNPYVRRFLQREMVRAGYNVSLAENRHRLICLCQSLTNCPELVIVDPDLPATDAVTLLSELRRHAPDMPVVIHSHNLEDIAPLVDDLLWFIEKHGNSIEKIIRLAGRILGYRTTT